MLSWQTVGGALLVVFKHQGVHAQFVIEIHALIKPQSESFTKVQEDVFAVRGMRGNT